MVMEGVTSHHHHTTEQVCELSHVSSSSRSSFLQIPAHLPHPTLWVRLACNSLLKQVGLKLKAIPLLQPLEC